MLGYYEGIQNKCRITPNNKTPIHVVQSKCQRNIGIAKNERASERASERGSAEEVAATKADADADLCFWLTSLLGDHLLGSLHVLVPT